MPNARQSMLQTPGEYTGEETDALACSTSHWTIPLNVEVAAVTSILAAFTDTDCMPVISTGSR